MEKKINIAAILKTFKPGLVLYDRMRKTNVRFYRICIRERQVCIECRVRVDDRTCQLFYSEYGSDFDFPNGECLLSIPSGAWEELMFADFKDGDILYVETSLCEYVFIKKGNELGKRFTLYYALIYKKTRFLQIQEAENPVCDEYNFESIRFATDEEKDLLFDVLKQNGWYWNKEKKELVRDEGSERKSEFKVFDKVNLGKPNFRDGDILTVMSDNGPLVYIKRGDGREDGHIHFHVIRNITPIRLCASNEERKKNIESVDMDSVRYALNEERIPFFSGLSKNGWKWDDETCRVEFTGAPPRCYLRAFDPVLVRTGNEAIWRPSFFGYKEKSVMLENPYVCTNGSRWAQCIPYNENEELIGTSDVPRIGC